MIVRPAGEGLLVCRQTEHALLAAAFAEAWGNERFAGYPEAQSVLVAAARHDDGWAEWELAPTITQDGHPVDFLRIGVAEHTALYRRGIDLVEAEDAYAGLLSSLHGKRLYTRPLQPDGPPRYSYLKPDDFRLAEEFVAGEVAREKRLLDEIAAGARREPSAVRDELDEAWRLLQVWDRLSIFVCLQDLDHEADFTLPAVADASGTDVQLRVQTASGDIVLDPYPFRSPDACFEIESIVLGAQQYDDVASYRRAYRAATRTITRFAVRAPAPASAQAQSV